MDHTENDVKFFAACSSSVYIVTLSVDWRPRLGSVKLHVIRRHLVGPRFVWRGTGMASGEMHI